MKEKAIFILGLVLAACGILSAPAALICGLSFGLLVEQHPFAAESRSASRFLLQAAVVCLGFGMNLAQVVHAGRSGFVYTGISISVATTLGLLLGMWLKVAKKASFLITMGTAICGGSAIAALSPVLEADDDAIAVDALYAPLETTSQRQLRRHPISLVVKTRRLRTACWTVLN